MAHTSARGWRLAEALFLVATALALLFAVVAREQGRLALAIRVDTTVENRVHTWFQATGIRILQGISFFGSAPFLLPASAGVAIWLYRIGARRRLQAFLFAMGGAVIWVQLLKEFFRRVRPDLFDPLVRAIGFSFPSGHSTLSATFYGALAGLAAAACRSRRCAIRSSMLGVGAIFLIGFSRVALGVHWPTDVLGGWSLGFAWLTLVFGLAEARARGERA
jgi:undecaprenyl-diphosphatase